MTIFLPTNYDPPRKYALLIYLNGADGGPAFNPANARRLTEDKDFVCVDMPLFKPADSPNKIVMHPSDAAFITPIYRTMLAKLDQVVPNIDPHRRVLGGFFNGAHTTALLINNDETIADYFAAFFLNEGGGALNRFDRLKGKPLFMACGKWNPNPGPALQTGVVLTLHQMKQPIHDFPLAEYPVWRAWLLNAVGQTTDSAPLQQAATQAGGHFRVLLGKPQPTDRPIPAPERTATVSPVERINATTSSTQP